MFTIRRGFVIFLKLLLMFTQPLSSPDLGAEFDKNHWLSRLVRAVRQPHSARLAQLEYSKHWGTLVPGRPGRALSLAHNLHATTSQ